MANFVKLGWAGVLLGMTALVGCGSSSSGSGSEPLPTAESFPAQAADVLCSAAGPCCSAQNFSFDGNACVSFIQSVYQAEAAHVGATATWDGEAAKRCLDEMASATKGCSTLSRYTAPDCQKLTTGTVAVGGACQGSTDCAASAGQSAVCSIDISTNQTTCRASEPFLKLGESCRSGGECVPGATCDFVSGICVAPAADGAPCTVDDDCMSERCTSSVCSHKPLADAQSCALN